MASNLTYFIRASKALSSSTVGVISGYYLQKSISEGSEFYILYLLIAVILVCILLIGVDFVLLRLIDKLKFLRRAVLGSDFIEGFWLQMVVPESHKDEIPRFGIIRIAFEGTQYKITGDSFQPNGELIASFITYLIQYEKHQLKYSFEAHVADVAHNKIIGNTELLFTSFDSGIASSYTGTVYSNIRDVPVKVRAYKIPEEYLPLEFSKEGRKSIIQKVINIHIDDKF